MKRQHYGFVWLLIRSATSVSFGFIKNTQNAATSVTSLVITIPAAKVGHLVIVNIKFVSAVTGVTVTDNASTPNTYALAVGPISGTGGNISQFYGVQVTGGATQITISWTGSSTIRAGATEFSGGQKTNAAVFDKAASASGTGTAAAVVIAPTAVGELLMSGAHLNTGASAPVAGANYILATTNTSLTEEYRLSGTTSETAPETWTTSVGWAQAVGAYIPLDASMNFMRLLK